MLTNGCRCVPLGCREGCKSERSKGRNVFHSTRPPHKSSTLNPLLLLLAHAHALHGLCVCKRGIGRGRERYVYAVGERWGGEMERGREGSGLGRDQLMEGRASLLARLGRPCSASLATSLAGGLWADRTRLLGDLIHDRNPFGLATYRRTRRGIQLSDGSPASSGRMEGEGSKPRRRSTAQRWSTRTAQQCGWGPQRERGSSRGASMWNPWTLTWRGCPATASSSSTQT